MRQKRDNDGNLKVPRHKNAAPDVICLLYIRILWPTWCRLQSSYRINILSNWRRTTVYNIIGKRKEKAAVERDDHWLVSKDKHYKSKTAGWGSEVEW